MGQSGRGRGPTHPPHRRPPGAQVFLIPRSGGPSRRTYGLVGDAAHHQRGGSAAATVPGGRIHSAHSVALARGRWAVEPLPKGSAAGIRLAVRLSPHGRLRSRQTNLRLLPCLCGPPRLQESPPVPTSFTILSHISILCTTIPSCLAYPLPAGSLCGSLADQNAEVQVSRTLRDGHRHLAVLAAPLSPGNSL